MTHQKKNPTDINSIYTTRHLNRILDQNVLLKVAFYLWLIFWLATAVGYAVHYAWSLFK